MSNKHYDKLLNSPKWRRKCKHILQRDGFECTVCGSKENLQVHHSYYFSDYPEPWKYPDKSLLTVCHDCHKSYHECREVEVRKNTYNKKAKGPMLVKKVEPSIPERKLIKVKHGNGYIYELKTAWAKKIA